MITEIHSTYMNKLNSFKTLLHSEMQSFLACDWVFYQLSVIEHEPIGPVKFDRIQAVTVPLSEQWTHILGIIIPKRGLTYLKGDTSI